MKEIKCKKCGYVFDWPLHEYKHPIVQHISEAEHTISEKPKMEAKGFLIFLISMDIIIWSIVFLSIPDTEKLSTRIIICNLVISAANMIVAFCNLAGITGKIEDLIKEYHLR